MRDGSPGGWRRVGRQVRLSLLLAEKRAFGVGVFDAHFRRLLEVVGIGEFPLQLHLLQDLAVAHRLARSFVDHAAFASTAIRQLRAERLGAGFGQRDAPERASARDAIKFRGHTAAVDRVRQSIHREVFVKVVGKFTNTKKFRISI